MDFGLLCYERGRTERDPSEARVLKVALAEALAACAAIIHCDEHEGEAHQWSEATELCHLAVLRHGKRLKRGGKL